MSGPPTAPLLDVRGLAFGYGGRFRLVGVSFAVARGEIFGVVGPNSAGKTTLLRLLSKVHAPEAGEVRLDGVPLDRLSRREVARRVAVVPQELAVAFPFTVEELCLMGRYPHAAHRLFEDAGDTRRAQDAMTLAGVAELAPQPVDTLAGGERQRVLLARALAQEPEVLLLDEPTSHLDLRHQREMVGLLRRLNRERGLTVVFVSHDLTLAAEIADRLLLLVDGRAVQAGAPAEVLSEAMLESAYGCPVVVEKSPLSGRPVVHVRWK
ncbi:MAG TPA: ABC transporter ATP-binding protein [Methylomirabilota bacterium]|nr:ABC transporter ATP-binding protein [Methylomirabilota bacterium]